MADRYAISHDAAVHPKTVTEISRRVLDGEPTRATSRPRLRARPGPGPVETMTLAHPAVWSAALKRAGGDARRIKVHSWTRVEIID